MKFEIYKTLHTLHRNLKKAEYKIKLTGSDFYYTVFTERYELDWEKIDHIWTKSKIQIVSISSNV